MNKTAFYGTGQLLKLLIRQNRFKIIAWVFGIVLVSLAVALAYPEIYTSQEDIIGFALTMENPAMSALIGSNYVTEGFNLGAVYASVMLLFTAIAVAIMNILMMKTSLRGDEEAGRLEVIQALPVGRISYIAAGYVMILFVNLALVILLTLGLTFLGHEVYTFESSLLYSAILAAIGLFFSGVTGVCAQLASSTYGTNVLSMGILLVSYVVRVIGDVQNETISLFSPLGWATRTEVFVDDQWLPVVVLMSGALLLIVVSFVLYARRDMFAGILPDRPGKPSASTFLKTMPGMVWSFEKTKIIAWFLLLLFLSLTFGSILGELEVYFSDMDIIETFLADSAGSNMIEQFIGFVVAIMSTFTLFPVLMVLYGMKKEETSGHLEHLYARSVSRNKVVATYLLFSFLTAVLMQLAIASGIYFSSAEVLAQAISLSTLTKMAFVYLPAIFVVIGLGVLLIGYLPRLTPAIWGYVLFIILILYLGGILDFPDWLNNLSAFHFIPEYPYEEINCATLVILTTIGLGLTLLGFIGYNQRDIEQ